VGPVEVWGPLWSDGKEYRLLVQADGRVDVEVGGVVRASTYAARMTHLIGDLYSEGVIQRAFACAEEDG
jgi:hypothetical protein